MSSRLVLCALVALVFAGCQPRVGPSPVPTSFGLTEGPPYTIRVQGFIADESEAVEQAARGLFPDRTIVVRQDARAALDLEMLAEIGQGRPVLALAEVKGGTVLYLAQRHSGNAGDRSVELLDDFNAIARAWGEGKEPTAQDAYPISSIEEGACEPSHFSPFASALDGLEDQLTTLPQLIGGISRLQNSLGYPSLAQRAEVGGEVMARMIVGTEGEVQCVSVLAGLPYLNEHTARLMYKARFEPGLVGEEPVRFRFSLPITYRLR